MTITRAASEVAIDQRFEVIVPRPNLITATEDTLTLATDQGAPRPVVVDLAPELTDAALLIEVMANMPGLDGIVAGNEPLPERDGSDPVAVRLDISRGNDGSEGYELNITPDAISISGSDDAGVFWGLQTLRQLLPVSRGGAKAIELPTGTITDSPRFEWRGVMLDVARHFFAVEDVLRFIDAMALYKMNRLHLHLSDDQGWRLAIEGYPELTEIGGSTQVGNGPGGFYTHGDYRSIVEYAGARHVMVVPEIDLPGHTNAALSSRPELNCDGLATEPFRGIEVGFSSLCIGTPETKAFVEAVLTQVAEMTPGPYLHIGGDEAESTTPAEYRAFIEDTDALVRELGKTTMGWEDVAAADLHKSTVVQVWRDEQAERIDEQNLSIVASPAAHTYLDQKLSNEMDIGFTWAGVIDTQRAYEWDPTQLGGATVLGAIPVGEEPTDATPEERILGVEGPLWSETFERYDQLTQLAFPRAAALAEVGWTQRDLRSWDGFVTRFAGHPERLALLGVTPSPDRALGP